MRLRRTLAAVAGLALAAAPVAAQQPSVEYEIAFPNAAQHEARVTATFRGVPRGQPLQVRMSRSSPGRYAPHAFAKNVYDAAAADSRGRALAVTRPDPYGWNVAGHDGTVRVTYTVWGDRTDGTYLGIDRSHAHLNMPATFMWARGMTTAPVRLTIRPQPGWTVATQLRTTADATVFTAPNMQYFMDSPTEVGPITMRSWDATYGGRKFTWRLAVHHTGTEAQVDSYTVMAKRVVDEEVAAWGEPAAYDFGSYTFIADYLPWANGDGMEHRNSTIITSSRGLGDHASRVALLGTLAHEFFHSWNVERLRPRSLEPFDFERENMSGELWFAEGFTSYYDDLFVRRAGYLSDEEYAGALASPVNAVINTPARRHGSAVEMSRQAPFVDAGVSLDPTNARNTHLSYYTWGSAIGLGLDLTLRTRFNMTLDDYMRAVWSRYGRPQTAALAPERPYTEADLRATLGEVTRDTAFANDFFRRYVAGREVVDYERLLRAGGFVVSRATPGRPFLGGSLENDSAAVLVSSVLETGSLYPAGISGGDRIHSVDGEATPTSEALGAIVARHRAGDVVRVEVSGRGARRTVPVTLVERPDLQVKTFESAGLPVTDSIRAFRRSWLGSRVGR
ncbi:MAG TPA: PDZ domain-containing protein [Longimicrobium sp.]|jgi:predicted metalloprotease with PDZ domain